MDTQLSGNKRIFCIIALISSGYGIFSDAVVKTLWPSIFAELSCSSLFWTNFAISGGYAVGLVMSVVTGLLARYISKRKLMIVGCALFCLGGIGGVFTNSIPWLIVCRSLDGMSDGMLTVAGLALIPELFRDEKTRTQLIGFRMALCGVYALIVGVAAGYICLIQWRYAFLLNLVGIIPLVFSVLGIPETLPERGLERDKGMAQGVPIPAVCLVILAALITTVLFGSFTQLISFYVEEAELGGPVITGYANSAINMIGMLLGFVYSGIYLKTRRATSLIAYAMMVAALIPLGGSVSIVTFFTCCSLSGIAYGLMRNYYATAICNIVPAGSMSAAMMWLSVAENGGSYLCPYMVTVNAFVTGNGTYAACCLTSGISMAALFVISALFALNDRKRPGSKWNTSVNLEIETDV